MHFKHTELVYPLIYTHTYTHMLRACPAALVSPIKFVKMECKSEEEIKETERTWLLKSIYEALT